MNRCGWCGRPVAKGIVACGYCAHLEDLLDEYWQRDRREDERPA